MGQEASRPNQNPQQQQPQQQQHPPYTVYSVPASTVPPQSHAISTTSTSANVSAVASDSPSSSSALPLPASPSNENVPYTIASVQRKPTTTEGRIQSVFATTKGSTAASSMKSLVTNLLLSGGSNTTISLEEAKRSGQHVEGIITVSTGAPASSHAIAAHASSGNTTKGEIDPVLADLEQLPQFYPLIKSSVDKTWKFNIHKHSPNSLDVVDSKPMVDMLATFQTFYLHQSRSLSARQEVVIRKIRECEVVANRGAQVVAGQTENLKKTSASLKDVERLHRLVEQTKESVDVIMKQLNELQAILAPRLPPNANIAFPTPTIPITTPAPAAATETTPTAATTTTMTTTTTTNDQ